MDNDKMPQRDKEVFSVISRMFAKKGYIETTMREIAGELNMKPASLYNYFRSKEEALFRLLKDSIDNANKELEKICDLDISAEEKLYKLIDFYTYAYSTKKEGPILLLNHVDKLSEEHRQILIDEQKRLVDRAAGILEALIKEGKVKPFPPKIVLFAFFGMTNYSLKWYNPEGEVNPLELVRYFSEIFTKGIMK